MAKTIQLDTKAIITGVVTSLVLGGVSGIWAWSNIVDANTLRLDFTLTTIKAHQARLDQLDAEFVPRYEIDNRLSSIEKSLERIEKKL